MLSNSIQYFVFFSQYMQTMFHTIHSPFSFLFSLARFDFFFQLLLAQNMYIFFFFLYSTEKSNEISQLPSSVHQPFAFYWLTISQYQSCSCKRTTTTNSNYNHERREGEDERIEENEIRRPVQRTAQKSMKRTCLFARPSGLLL